MTEERSPEPRLDYIKDMANILGFPAITDGDMGNYRYIRFEDNIDPDKRLITIRAEIYPEKVKTEIIFDKKTINFSREFKMKMNEALDVASLIDELYDYLKRD